MSSDTTEWKWKNSLEISAGLGQGVIQEENGNFYVGVYIGGPKYQNILYKN